MAMDLLSKYVCLIGILHIIVYSMHYMEPEEDSLFWRPPHEPEDLWAVFRGTSYYKGFFVTMSFFAALMIVGVLTKITFLLAPFLMISFMYLWFQFLSLFFHVLTRPELMSFFYEIRGFKIVIAFLALHAIVAFHEKFGYEKERSTKRADD